MYKHLQNHSKFDHPLIRLPKRTHPNLTELQISSQLAQFQEEFSHGGFSVLKTMVMMLGEVDFSSVFAQNEGYGGIAPTAALPYPYQTLLLFAVFVLVVPIVVMNLLVIN